MLFKLYKNMKNEVTQAEVNKNMLRMNGYESIASKRKRADRLAYQIDGFDAWCKLIDEIRQEERELKI